MTIGQLFKPINPISLVYKFIKMTISHYNEVFIFVRYNGAMKSKVLQNKEEKKEKILAAAFSLFTRKDINNVTVAEIAKEAGIAKGTFYLYFKDKIDLQNFLITLEAQKLFEKASKDLIQTGITNFEDSVLFLIAMVLKQLEDSVWLLNFIRHNLSMGVFSSYITSSFENDTHSLQKLFRQRASEAGYHYENPDATLFMIIDLASTTCFDTLIDHRPMSYEEFKPHLFEAIRAILRTGKPADEPEGPADK